MWQESALMGKKSTEGEEKRVPGWEQSGKWDTPTHQALGTVANCPGNAQGCPENGQASDIWARDLQGESKPHRKFSCEFPDLYLLVLQG